MFRRWVVFAISGAAAIAQTGEGEAIFQKHVAPLLAAKCAGCHGGAQKISGFSAASREELLRGGNRGPAMVPGASGQSLLLAVLSGTHEVKMPPGARLPDESVAAVRRWIDLGAPWSSAVPSTKPAETADRWAFRPLSAEAKPPSAGHPIDAFLEAKQKALGLRVAPRADRRTLIRRATFDLWGLPPTAAEVEAFERDKSAEAWPKLIGRLLASPRYGERWGRHWLDVVRYADSGGFSNDYERPNAWRYRDYVIRAFNQDKRYGDFVVEQIAGDELDASKAENLVATGFLRMGPWEHTAMSVAAVTRQEWLDDVTHSTAATFLGVTLECARCHDHKFDPIPTKDYYSIQSAFATTEFAERPAPFLAGEERANFSAGRSELEKRLAANKAKLAEFESLVRGRFVAQNPQATPQEIAVAVRTKKLLNPEEYENFKVFQKREQLLAKSIERYSPVAYSVRIGPADEKAREKWTSPETFILPVGNLMNPGAKVSPAVLAAAHWNEDCALPVAVEGRRLALARWIADERNPLTYRTIVNRVWHHHFGQGLVRTPNDLGKMGQRPTHPELLDYLATRFISGEGRFKALHRLLMTSAAYQRSGAAPDPAALAEKDPDHRLLTTFTARRHEAEVIRDSVLFAAGELSLGEGEDTGGPGVFPEINLDVANQPVQIMGTLMPAYRPSVKARDRHRRTIYTYQQRNLVDPLLEVFNGPSLAESTAKRDATTIPTQAYALMNGQLIQDMALAMASRSAATADPIADLYRRALQRAPSARERTLMTAHWQRRTAEHAQRPARPLAQPGALLRSITSELTGDSVMVREDDPLLAMEPNLQPHQVTPRVRALADLARVLLNANEFLYRD